MEIEVPFRVWYTHRGKHYISPWRRLKIGVHTTRNGRGRVQALAEQKR